MKKPRKKRGRPPLWKPLDNDGLLFVRYPNRRFYDVNKHAYVHSEALLQHHWKSIYVVDYATQIDITRWAIALAKHEVERKKLRAEAVALGIKR